jgi:hypothetical protein
MQLRTHDWKEVFFIKNETSDGKPAKFTFTWGKDTVYMLIRDADDDSNDQPTFGELQLSVHDAELLIDCLKGFAELAKQQTWE